MQHTHTQPFYGSMDFVLNYLGEPVPEETFTHLHLSWSSIVPYLLHTSNTIHGILPVHSTHLTLLFRYFQLLWICFAFFTKIEATDSAKSNMPLHFLHYSISLLTHSLKLIFEMFLANCMSTYHTVADYYTSGVTKFDVHGDLYFSD